MICFVFGHRFEPRYDTTETENPGWQRIESTDGVHPAEVRELMILRTQTYVGDVCEMCGRVAPAGR